MKVIRWLLAIILSFVLYILIFISIPITTLSVKLTNPEVPKQWLNDSQIYSNIPEILPSIVGLVKTDDEFTSIIVDELKDEQSEIHNSLENLMDPELLQSSTEKIIDAFYDWFKGNSKYPQVEAPFIEDEKHISDFLLSTYLARIDALPECEYSYLYFSDYDNPLDMTCMPKGTDREYLKEYLEDETLNSQEYIKQVEELKELATIKEDLFQDLRYSSAQVQLVYLVFSWSPYILLSSSLLIFLLILLLIPGRKAKYIFTGLVVFLSSIPVVISRIFLSYQLVDSIKLLSGEYMGDVQGDVLNQVDEKILNVLTIALEDIFSTMNIISLSVTGIGVGLIVLGIVLKPKEVKSVKKEEKVVKEVDQEGKDQQLVEGKEDKN